MIIELTEVVMMFCAYNDSYFLDVLQKFLVIYMFSNIKITSQKYKWSLV